jgi:hypothetical protein
MAPNQSTLRWTGHEDVLKQQGDKFWRPSIPFKKQKAKEKPKTKNFSLPVDDPDYPDYNSDSDNSSGTVPLNPRKKKSKLPEITHKVPTFENGMPEEWCELRANVD